MLPKSLLLMAFSLRSAVVALFPDQLPVVTVGKLEEPSVLSLDVSTSRADNTYEFVYKGFNSDAEQLYFDQGPSENDTWNLVFDTVYSLLQRWPNTRYRNGHNIVPGVIPAGAFLYHGTPMNAIPTGPEWTATSQEHSILFCRTVKGGGWHLTLAVTRPLKVLYFDGSSAAKLTEGTIDTQDIITWGEPQPDRIYDEAERIRYLCAWGKQFKIDAFVRMQWNFEVMLCNFTAGVKVMSFLHVVTPEDEEDSPGPSPPHADISNRVFAAIHSGSWHNHYPGEPYIVLDLTGFVSLYDTTLAPSLIHSRANLERCDHRVLGISSDDISRVMRRLTEIVSRPDPVGSDINWNTFIRVIVDRYADRLELMHHLLDFTTSDSQEHLERAKLVQTQLRIMLTPYLLYSTVIPNRSASSNGLHWAYPIFKQCVTAYTSDIIPKIPFITSSEHLLLKAVQEVTKEICRVTTKMWSAGVLSGLDALFKVEPSTVLDTAQLIGGWSADTQKLMSWLDWSVWIKCRPACGPEEICYLPTWPLNGPSNPSDESEHPKYVPRMGHFTNPPIRQYPYPETLENWRKPQPRCIRSVQPYKF